MKTSDVLVVGAGIIGLSLARELHKRGATVRVVERGQPGHESSFAAAGMLVQHGPELPAVLKPLAEVSAALYPEFVHELEDESGLRVDLRTEGTIAFVEEADLAPEKGLRPLTAAEVSRLEPQVAPQRLPAWRLEEMTVDPRALTAACLKAALHRGVEVASGSPVTDLECEQGRIVGVRTTHTSYRAPAVVNCCGAWAGEIGGFQFPTRPVKGQMLSVAPAHRNLIHHVVRTHDVYLVPRSNGRILIGATVEEAGFDKRVDADTIHALDRAAVDLVPALAQARRLEAWAGLRPGTPDDLPILGPTSLPGYFVATGHFRNGILLAPTTALVMAEVVRGVTPSLDLASFSPARFSP
ncbi:MAG: glycine oxidase ThiO [Terriglobales bacterium]